MKVLLINPSDTRQLGFTNPPLWALYLAAVLEKNGIRADVIDGCIDGQEAVESKLKEGYDFVGATCLTPGRWKAFDTLALAKAYNPNCKTIIGGVHPSVVSIELPWIDYVVQGEGEGPIMDIVEGKLIVPRQIDIDSIPIPAYHKVDLSKYPGRGRTRLDFGRVNGVSLRSPRVSVIFSRGCTAHCNFCSTWHIWKKYRTRDPFLMVDELEYLVDRFKVRHIAFADDVFGADKPKTMAMLREIAYRGLRLAYHITTRTDCVDEELLEALKETGCYGIAYGIETGDEEQLRKIHKGVSIETQSEGIRLARKAGIHTTALVIVGALGETGESVEATFRFLRASRPDTVAAVGGLWVLPGTAVSQEAKRRGWLNEYFWYTRTPYMVWGEHSQEQLRLWQDRIWRYSLWPYIRRKVRRFIERIIHR